MDSSPRLGDEALRRSRTLPPPARASWLSRDRVDHR